MRFLTVEVGGIELTAAFGVKGEHTWQALLTPNGEYGVDGEIRVHITR